MFHVSRRRHKKQWDIYFVNLLNATNGYNSERDMIISGKGPERMEG